MTKIVISILLAIAFIVLSLSQTIIPCNELREFDFCKLEGEQPYYYTEKFSDPVFAGIASFVIVFLVMILLLSLIFPKPKMVRFKWINKFIKINN